MCDERADRHFHIGSIEIDTLWKAFAQALTDLPARTSTSDILGAFWRLLSCCRAYSIQGTPLINHIQQTAYPYSASITSSIVALLRSQCLRVVFPHGEETPIWRDPIFLSEAAGERASGWAGADVTEHTHEPVRSDDNQLSFLRLSLVADFLESCAGSENYPFEAVRTLQSIQAFSTMPSAIHSTLQLRLADAIQSVFGNSRCNDLREVVIKHSIFFSAASGRNSPPTDRCPWLDSKLARRKIRNAFAAFAEEKSNCPEPPLYLPLLQETIGGLEPMRSLEPESPSTCTIWIEYGFESSQTWRLGRVGGNRPYGANPWHIHNDSE
ncbi:hypothetical protein K438DRAFT_1763767 [Mycena galopus ATCC 62051]|nr:hypothetical protein K438DRAFT_1763767 [Mycena galopus ATCC 62051]